MKSFSRLTNSEFKVMIHLLFMAATATMAGKVTNKRPSSTPGPFKLVPLPTEQSSFLSPMEIPFDSSGKFDVKFIKCVLLLLKIK